MLLRVPPLSLDVDIDTCAHIRVSCWSRAIGDHLDRESVSLLEMYYTKYSI